MDLELPRPSAPLVVVTHVLLALLFLIGVGAVIVLPGLADGTARAFPEYAELRDPLLALAIGFTLLALFGLAFVALLVDRIRRGRMLERTSLLWVDGVVTLLACAGVLVVVAFGAISRGQAGSPALAAVLITTLLLLAVLACITLVLRSLLRQAISMRAELDVVI